MKSTMKNMVIVLSLIASVMGGVLALVHQATLDPIKDAETKAKNDALASVLPDFDNQPSATAHSICLDGEVRPVTVYEATKQGDPAGLAVESWTSDGFSGDIIVMVGFDNKGTLTGYKVLQHSETPGLGAKADSWFCDSVGNRSVIGTASELKVAKDGGNIDGITAATITSRAFLDAVNRARKAYTKFKN